MKPEQKQIQQYPEWPDSSPRHDAMASEALDPHIGGGMFIYRELTAHEVLAIAGGPQIINDGVLPPP